MRYPLSKIHITQPFGVNPKDYPKTGGHTGIDMRARYVPVYAAKKGSVTLFDTKERGYGKHIRLYHPDGSQSLYAHLSEYRVENRQDVEEGDIIGISGDTGRSTAPHLHFAYRPTGFNYTDKFVGYVDPILFMDKVKIKITYDTPDNPISATTYQSLVSFFNTANTQIEFVYKGDFHMRLNFKDFYPEGHKYDARTGGADTPTTFKSDEIWDVTIEISDSGWKFPNGTVSTPDTYEQLIAHEILHEFFFVMGMGDLHTSNFNQYNNQAALDALIDKLDNPLTNHIQLIEDKMYGLLVKGHPDPSKIYFVRGGKRAHVKGAKYLSFIWNWNDVITISKSKWDKLEEVEPVGFAGIPSILELLKRLLSK